MREAPRSARATYVVKAVVVGDIAASCAGGRMSVVLPGPGGSEATGGPVRVPDGGGQLEVRLDHRPAVESVGRVHIVIVGP